MSTTSTVGRRAWTLLDLDVQGRVYRYTDAPESQSITDAAGQTFAYVPGLGAMALARQADATTTSLSVVVHAPQEVPWSQMVARGHVLDRCNAIVRRWYEGQVLESAEVWIRGKVTSPAWGNSTEPLSFTVERLRRESGVIPLDTMLVSATTWPVTAGFTTSPAVLGSWYPMVYGAPAGALTPAYLVEYKAADLANCKLLIAGHRVGASNVTLHDVRGGQSASTPVLTMTDLLGRTVSYVDFNTVTFSPEEDREYRIAWDVDGGGYIEAGVTLAGAGEVMLHLFKAWTDMDIDEGRFAAAKSALDSYALAFCITEQIPVWEYVDGEIISLLPVEWTESANGEYPVLWRIGATASEAQGHIDCTRVTGRYTRTGQVEGGGTPIANRFTLQYGVGGPQSRPQKTVTIGSGLTLLGAEDISDGTIPDARCAISERIFGRRPAPVAKSEIIDDTTTATLIVQQWALLYSLPRRRLQVSGDLSLDAHPLNGLVTVTATDVNITAEIALVRAKSPSGDEMTIDLLLLDSPLTRLKAIT